MGRFVNPDNSAFQVALNSKIYIDKTGLIACMNDVLDSTDGYICNSRPRRFGKSYAANMLAAYYSKGADSEEMFFDLEIGKTEDFKKHLNKSIATTEKYMNIEDTEMSEAMEQYYKENSGLYDISKLI